MSIDEQTAARIDDYLNNKLSEIEKGKFETELATNPELADELRIQENLLQIFGENGITTNSASTFSKEAIDEVSHFLSGIEMEKIRKSIREVNDRYLQKHPKSRSLVYRFVGIAASIVLIISISLFLPLNNSASDLYSKYKDSIPPISMIERSENNQTLEAIEKNFKAENFNEVIRLIQNNSELNAKAPTLLLYQGIAFRELNQPENAINSFIEFGKLSDLDTDLMYWHQGIVYLKTANFTSILYFFYNR